jgi:hypothetical protein
MWCRIFKRRCGRKVSILLWCWWGSLSVVSSSSCTSAEWSSVSATHSTDIPPSEAGDGGRLPPLPDAARRHPLCVSTRHASRRCRGCHASSQPGSKLPPRRTFTCRGGSSVGMGLRRPPKPARAAASAFELNMTRLGSTRVDPAVSDEATPEPSDLVAESLEHHTAFLDAR